MNTEEAVEEHVRVFLHRMLSIIVQHKWGRFSKLLMKARNVMIQFITCDMKECLYTLHIIWSEACYTCFSKPLVFPSTAVAAPLDLPSWYLMRYQWCRSRSCGEAHCGSFMLVSSFCILYMSSLAFPILFYYFPCTHFYTLIPEKINQASYKCSIRTDLQCTMH